MDSRREGGRGGERGYLDFQVYCKRNKTKNKREGRERGREGERQRREKGEKKGERGGERGEEEEKGERKGREWDRLTFGFDTLQEVREDLSSCCSHHLMEVESQVGNHDFSHLLCVGVGGGREGGRGGREGGREGGEVSIRS